MAEGEERPAPKRRKAKPNVEGLRELPDGRFRFRIYADGRKDGRRVQVTLEEGTSRKDAEAAYAAAVARAKARAGRLIPREITFRAAAEEYLASHKARALESSHETVKAIFEAKLIPAFGPRRLDSLRPSDVVRWAERQDAAPRVVNHAVGYLVAAVRHALALGWLDRDIFPRGSVPPLRVSKAPPLYLTPEEWGAFLAVAEADRPDLVPIFRALVLTACRAGEVCGLTWQAVDLENGSVAIGMSKLRGAVKTLPLLPELRALLESLPRGTPAALVFPAPDGGAWGVKRVSSAFRALVRRAGLRPALHLHSLRHSGASWAIQAGVPVAEVSKALGHSSLAQTSVYAHLEPKHLSRAFGAIETVEKSARAPLRRHRDSAK